MTTQIKDQGRVDWLPRRKVWRVVGYYRNKDITIGYATDRETAAAILQDWIKEAHVLTLGVGG